MYLFSSEELKAKAPLAEPYMLDDVILLNYKPQRRETGTQLKQATESTREDKTMNGKKSERLL